MLNNVSYRSIYALFAERAQTHPNKLVIERSGGAGFTYASLLECVQQVAAELHTAGVVKGDRVASQVEKSPEAVATYLATLQLGAIFLPLNTAYTETELAYFIDDADPSLIIVDPTKEREIQALAPHLNIRTLDSSGQGSLLKSTTRRDVVEPVEASDEAAILYTSGTTGRSKGAVLSHENLVSNCLALLDAWEFDENDRLIHALPIFHIHGLFVAVNMTLVAGATMQWLEKFDADLIIDHLETATVLMGVPTFYTRLVASSRLTPDVVSNMRLFISGSAPLLASDHAAFSERTGHQILERYGMTETGMNTSNPYRGERRPGSVGFPLPGVEVIVANPQTGEELPVGDMGSIEVRGPNVFDRYWRNPEKTNEEKRDSGFFITGDQGFFSSDGYLNISGRAKDMIICGGYNVYPKEIELLLDAHPKVTESAVIGVPHPDLGEGIVGVLVLENGQTLSDEELREFIQDDIARFKQPRAYRVIAELPRNVMGKVQKAELREAFLETFQQQQESAV